MPNLTTCNEKQLVELFNQGTDSHKMVLHAKDIEEKQDINGNAHCRIPENSKGLTRNHCV